MLALNRHVLPGISTLEANAVLSVLKQLWQQKHISETARLTAFSQAFQLLAIWAHAYRLSTATSAADREQLHEAVTNAIQLLQSPWATAPACAACILFVGAASQGKHSRTKCHGVTEHL